MKTEIIKDESGWEPCEILRITYEDGTVSEINDSIPPEDISFHRNLAVFVDEIERAHQKGFEQGWKEAVRSMEEGL